MFRKSRIHLLFHEDIYPETRFLALNPGEGYGLLRVMGAGERAGPRDVVIYETLPNELPRVAGIVTTVPQTPLTHVNLRAVQDGIPNAFIQGAVEDTDIALLIDGYVHYTVTESGYTIRAATPRGSRCPLRVFASRSGADAAAGPLGHRDHPPHGSRLR